MKRERLYKSDISTARWILYFVGLILSFVHPPDFMADKGATVFAAVSVIPALLMLVGIVELISERIHKLDRMLPRIRMLRGFGALTLGGILGTVVAAVMLIFAAIAGKGDTLYVWLMLVGGILCGLFAGLLFMRYRPVEK